MFSCLFGTKGKFTPTPVDVPKTNGTTIKEPYQKDKIDRISQFITSTATTTTAATTTATTITAATTATSITTATTTTISETPTASPRTPQDIPRVHEDLHHIVDHIVLPEVPTYEPVVTTLENESRSVIREEAPPVAIPVDVTSRNGDVHSDTPLDNKILVDEVEKGKENVLVDEDKYEDKNKNEDENEEEGDDDLVEIRQKTDAGRRGGVQTQSVFYNKEAIESITKHPKDPEDDKLIRQALQKNEFLNKILRGDLLKEVVDAMYNREISSKETIIKEGEKGNHMYVSAKGTYETSVKGKGVVNTFSDVRAFGELAILYNDKRLATIKAIKPGRVWVLDRTVYQQLMVKVNIKEQDERVKFLSNVDKLNTVGDQVLIKVATLLKSEFFTTGTEIVRQGDHGDKFYIISAGTVTITKEKEGVIGVFKRGQYFGELALLHEDTRQATVTADAPGVECLSLERKHFIDHFGAVEDISNITVEKSATPRSSTEESSEYSDISFTDLNIKATLGVGGFGRVELVQHKTKPDLTFALKYLKKIDMVEQNQQEHVFNEKTLQMSCRSIFIIRLYRTYKDRKYIYFLMESCLGGDLWTLLQKQKNRRFEEKDARFIAACVLEAFAYLHERGIVYRDLKPENLLIDKQGYIKLTDFGFAKKLGARGRTFTFAGTPEYVAPEIVLNKGHDKAVDYWAFGIFIFELLVGKTPFRTNDSSHMKTYNKILSGIDNVEFPSFVPHKASHIVEKLCRSVPTERLGCQRNGIKDVRNHKWFMGFDWVKLNDKKLSSSFKPKLKHAVDTQYFDKFKPDNDNPPEETSGWDADF